jgi:putative flippase GtrA
MSSGRKRSTRFFVFSLVGIFNTLFDIALYVIMYNLTGSIIIANVVATSAALFGSYALNSRITFKAKQWTIRSFLLFVLVTLFGLWVLQTSLIYAFTPLLHYLPEHIWQSFGPLEHTAKTVVPKLLATVVTFLWNFAWYHKVIFRDAEHEELKRAIEVAEV